MASLMDVPLVGDAISGLTGSGDAATAARDAAALQQRAVAPWSAAGKDALGQLQALLPDLTRRFTMDQFTADPGYLFRQQQGEQAINRAAGAGGSRYSGATLKALNKFNSGLASQEFGNAFNRDLAERGFTFNSLAGLSNMGLDAASAGANAGAAGIVGAAQANAQGLQSLLNLGGTLGGAALLAPSDARLKRDVHTLDGAEALRLVSQLRPVVWEWAQSVPSAEVVEGRGAMGVIAQEVREVLPELVHEGPDGFLRVDYGALTGLLLAAVQELARGLGQVAQRTDGLQVIGETHGHA